MHFDLHRSTQEITRDVSSEEFGPATYVTIRHSRTVDDAILPRDPRACPSAEDFVSRQNEWITQVTVPTPYFRERCEPQPGNPQWLLDVPREYDYQAITPEYYEAYRLNSHRKLQEAFDIPSDMRAILENGDFHLVVRDTIPGNGLMYDLGGEPILHDIRMHYIDGRLVSQKYKLDKLGTHLSSHPQVKDIEFKAVPYYNASCPGESCIELSFMPTREQFKDFIGGSQWDRYNRIRWLLGAEQFRVPFNRDADE